MADFAAYLLGAWELVSEAAIRCSWQCHSPDTEVPERELAAAPAE
jgi:hypothetical protein